MGAQCCIKDCFANVFAAGLCSKHYNRFRKVGSFNDGPRSRASLEERLWRQVKKLGANDCWEWLGASRIKGYGVIGLGGRGAGKDLAHRVAWIISNGPLPKIDGHHGAVVRHTCDNRLCCNPKHLVVGSQTDNVTDMDERGRRKTVSKRGSQHHNAKLTEDDVRAIRADTRSGPKVAADYGITKENVYYIKNRKAWKHI